MSRVSIAKLRRVLYVKGLTARPMCGTCGVQRDPKDFGKNGQCVHCDADAAFADAALSALRDRLPSEEQMTDDNVHFANADLIAAAPEMLAVLKRLVALRPGTKWDRMNEDYAIAMAASAVIAKAEGRDRLPPENV